MHTCCVFCKRSNLTPFSFLQQDLPHGCNHQARRQFIFHSWVHMCIHCFFFHMGRAQYKHPIGHCLLHLILQPRNHLFVIKIFLPVARCLMSPCMCSLTVFHPFSIVEPVDYLHYNVGIKNSHSMSNFVQFYFDIIGLNLSKNVQL